MSDFSSSYTAATLEAFDLFTNTNKLENFDPFLSFHSPGDLEAPPPESFEFDIDSGLEGLDETCLQLIADSNFTIPRGPAGPLSTFTASGVSDSASDDIFSDISSFYNQLTSPPTTNASSTFDLAQFQMEFQRGVRVGSDYGAPQHPLRLDDHDLRSFGQLPPTPPRSPPVPISAVQKGYSRSSFSDYGPPRRSSAADIFTQMGFGQSTVSPVNLSTQLPTLAPTMGIDDYKGDPRKKYKCPSCPRGFARAYNLKTHMGTHDPNRLKPHVCPHRSCGRSFSRKHDLGRHLISIHRDDTLSPKRAIGVGAGHRTWCDTCGKGSVGGAKECDCNDVK